MTGSSNCLFLLVFQAKILYVIHSPWICATCPVLYNTFNLIILMISCEKHKLGIPYNAIFFGLLSLQPSYFQVNNSESYFQVAWLSFLPLDPRFADPNSVKAIAFTGNKIPLHAFLRSKSSRNSNVVRLYGI